MLNRQYHHKEIKVFEAIFNLAKNGDNIETLSVQKIAEASGVAKGTIYEYFESKEEIIRQTIDYYLYQEISVYQSLLKTKCSFDELIEIIMNNMNDNRAICSSFEILFKYSSVQRKIFSDTMMPFVINYLNRLIQLGKEQGVINSSIDDSYARHVLIAGFSSYNIAARFKVKDNEIAKKQSIKMILSTLA